MISPKNIRSLQKIIPFGVISMISSFIYSLIEKGILGDYPSYPSTGNPYVYDPFPSAIFALILGLLIGLLEVQHLGKWFRKSSLLKKILLKTAIYMLLLTVFIILVITIGRALEMNLSPLNERVLEICGVFLSSFAFWTILLYVTAGIGVSLFYTEIGDNIGQGVLLNFFTGKYHRPKEEDRIFMFLDMKSSTPIAEKLGHVEYFKILKDYYSDLSDPIVKYGGEIYQYVGDEVVVSWKCKRAFKNNNPLQCFFAMKESLIGQSKKYIDEYGIIPTFKAGIHLGRVTTGEIGGIKKEIIFSGDFLNTTARIQGLCNNYKVDLLVSEDYLETIGHNSRFNSEALGATELRGRNKKINLHTINQN